MRKVMLSVVLVIAIFFTLCAPASAISDVASGMLGDVTNDSKVNSADVLQIKRHTLGITDVTVYSGMQGDINSDGKINSSDMLLVKKHILGIIDVEYYNLAKINFTNAYQRGVNLGNMLEAPNEGEWGQIVEDEYLTLIKNRGFDFVRVPIRWSNHQTNGIIDPIFFERIDHVISVILQNNLGAVINIHHFGEINTDPVNQAEILYKMWEQISQRYKDLPDTVSFEIMNEPNGQLTTAVWAPIQNKCIEIIRRTNPTRKIVVSAGDWGGPDSIDKLILPKDPNLILSFHYYSPFNFTHQGADWAGNKDKYLGTLWNGTDTDKMAIESTFKKVRAWSQATGIPVLLGEFGAYEKADYASRVRWTSFVRETAEKYGFSWSYWEFCAGFGIYDKAAQAFREELTKALVPDIPNTVLGIGTGTPRATAEITDTSIGPVKFHSIVSFINYSWTGIIALDTDNGMLINLGTCVDWGRVNFPVDITDTGTGFSKNIIEFKFKNINNSITDIGFNIENGAGTNEAIIKYYNSVSIFKSADGIVQNADGTTTVTLDISKAYGLMKDKITSGLNLKMFIESIPNNSGWYDRQGSMEVLSVKVR